MKLRFAARPGTPLHVGSARIALLAWLLVRRQGGGFALRLDDVGDAGAGPEALEADLRWLGLDWDLVVRQSERTALYEDAIGRLKAAGRLYPCFEGEEELEFKRAARVRRGEVPIYDRAMLKLTAEQRSRAEAGGKRPYWRFLLSGVPAVWDDMVLGRREVKLSALSDPVLVRADGVPLPALCAAVDDLRGGITHLVRGQEQLDGTGVQLDVMAALSAPRRASVHPGGTVPRHALPVAIRFAHVPPLLDAKGGKLQQRDSRLALRQLRGDGIEAAALAGTLARLGTRDAPSPALPRDMAAGFDLSALSRTPPRFDPARLLRVNRGALAGLPFEAVRDRLPAGATPAFWHSVRGALDLVREARGWWEVVSGTVVPPLVEGEGDLLRRAAAALPAEPWDGGTWDRWVTALHEATGRGARSLAAPLRLALTGEEDGPDLATLLPLIGQARVAERLRLAAA